MSGGIRTRRVLLVLAGALFLARAWAYAPYLLDDAYISLRYAANLADGHGLVFNPGERVEGYTNFAWVILGALFHRLGAADPMQALKACSALATLALLAAVARLERRALSTPSPVPAVAWLLVAAPFAYWATTGLETMAFAALGLVAFTRGLVERAEPARRRLSALAFGALALTRPEGALVFALAQLAYLALDRAEGHEGALRRRIADGLRFAAIFVPYLAWRLAYYGDLLPNTFHAKVTGGREQYLNGAINLASWAAAHAPLAVALLLPLVALAPGARGWWRRRPELAAVGFTALAYVAYLVIVGGDFMPFYRFYLPVLPLAAVLASAALASWWRRSPGIGPALLALVAVTSGGLDQSERALVADRTTVVGSEVGRRLAELRAPDTLLAVNTAGSLPYVSGFPTIDMLGLADRTIARTPVYVTSTRWAAHRRGNGAYVLSRWPDVVLWYNAAGARQPHYLGDHQLADLWAFRFFYQLGPMFLGSETGGPEHGRRLACFPGDPFGADGRSTHAPDLAMRVAPRPGLLPGTCAYSAPITAHLWEARADRVALRPMAEATGDDVASFLDAVIERWTAEAASRPAPDPAARARVEGRLAEVRAAIEAGDRKRAEDLLLDASFANHAARSPLVPQYIANLAALEANLPLAVQAQSEALRLEPTSMLYRRNLEHLLTVPWKRFQEHRS